MQATAAVNYASTYDALQQAARQGPPSSFTEPVRWFEAINQYVEKYCTRICCIIIMMITDNNKDDMYVCTRTSFYIYDFPNMYIHIYDTCNMYMDTCMYMYMYMAIVECIHECIQHNACYMYLYHVMYDVQPCIRH